MPRPGSLQTGQASMPRPGMLYPKGPAAKPGMTSRHGPDVVSGDAQLRHGLILEELVGMEKQVRTIAQGQSIVQAAVGKLETDLCSLITQAGCPPEHRHDCPQKLCFDLSDLLKHGKENDDVREGMCSTGDDSINMAAPPVEVDEDQTQPGHQNKDGATTWDTSGNGHHASEVNNFLDSRAGQSANPSSALGEVMGYKPSMAVVDVVARLVEPKVVEDDFDIMEGQHSISRSKAISQQVTRSHMSCQAGSVVLDLREILETNTRVQERQNARIANIRSTMGARAATVKSVPKIVEKWQRWKACDWEVILDSAIGSIILLNALFIGISMDAPDPRATALLVAEWIFGIIFWIELIVKVCAHGWREQYCGKDACLNIFDATLIVADMLQLIFMALFREQSAQLANSGFSASIFRVIRLLRLSRILRLLQSPVFKDLLTMVQGMLGGMTTLCWSVVLFVIFIYVVALVFRETLGPNPTRESNERIDRYFRNVPRAMFTIFRCSFGDCSTDGGTPIFEHVTESYGGMWSLIYCGFVFIVVIGLFNVISAIFVENTLAAASDLTAKKRREKHADKERWAVNVCALLQALLRQQRNDLPDLTELDEKDLSDELMVEILQCEFPRELVDYTVRDDEDARKALSHLDIDPSDHAFLGDILDPQNDGSITVLELVDGLKRLRGEPRRSDIITIDLMVRSLQERVDDIWKWSRQANLERRNARKNRRSLE